MQYTFCKSEHSVSFQLFYMLEHTVYDILFKKKPKNPV